MEVVKCRVKINISNSDWSNAEAVMPTYMIPDKTKELNPIGKVFLVRYENPGYRH